MKNDNKKPPRVIIPPIDRIVERSSHLSVADQIEADLMENPNITVGEYTLTYEPTTGVLALTPRDGCPLWAQNPIRTIPEAEGMVNTWVSIYEITEDVGAKFKRAIPKLLGIEPPATN